MLGLKGWGMMRLTFVSLSHSYASRQSTTPPLSQSPSLEQIRIVRQVDESIDGAESNANRGEGVDLLR